MEQNDQITMSRIAFERMQAKDERNDRWRNIMIVLLIILLVATNGMWLWAWNQYDYTAEYTEVKAEQDGTGVNIAGAGDISYGTESDDQKKSEKKNTQ